MTVGSKVSTAHYIEEVIDDAENVPDASFAPDLLKEMYQYWGSHSTAEGPFHIDKAQMTTTFT